jgi:hypothetical protein
VHSEPAIPTSLAAFFETKKETDTEYLLPTGPFGDAMAIDYPNSPAEDDPYRFITHYDKYATPAVPKPEPSADRMRYFVDSNDINTTVSSGATLISIDGANGIAATTASNPAGPTRIPGLPNIVGASHSTNTPHRPPNSTCIDAHVRYARRLADNGLAHSDAAITETLEHHWRQQDPLASLRQAVDTTSHNVTTIFYRLLEMERVFDEMIKHLDEIANLQRVSHAQIEACSRCLF